MHPSTKVTQITTPPEPEVEGTFYVGSTIFADKTYGFRVDLYAESLEPSPKTKLVAQSDSIEHPMVCRLGWLNLRDEGTKDPLAILAHYLAANWKGKKK